MDRLSDEKIVALLLLYRLIKRKPRQSWVHPLNMLRPSLGEHLKVEIMYSKHPQKFVEYTRLTPEQFDEVLGLIEVDLNKNDTNYRLSIPPRHRLFVGLR